MIKIASINSVAVLVRIISGFLTSKAIAIYLGPEGMALVGNLRNFLTAVQSFSTLGLYNGVVKYVSEFKDQVSKLSQMISTITLVTFFATIVVSLYCYFNAAYLNHLIFDESFEYTYIIKILAFVLPFGALNMFLLGILNGLARHKLIIIINIFGQILSLIITLFLIWQHRIDGALIAVVLTPSVILLVSFLGLYDIKKTLGLFKIGNFSFGALKNLSSYAIMSLFSSIALPTVALLIRKYIMDTIGNDEAGYWEAILRLSSYYLMFVSTLLTLYILPRFAEITKKKEFRNEIFSFYKNIMPIFAIGLVLIYLLRKFIIRLVFSDDFAPVEDLFLWQLLGDFVKVLSLVISYQFLAKKMVVHYLLVEALSVATIYFTSVYFIDNFGLKGVVIAHFVSYVFHFVVLLIIFNKSLILRKPLPN